MELELKSVLAIIATLISVAAFYPYVRDLLQGRTTPHVYTWLIWSITQGIAVAGLWYGGGGWGAVNLTVGLVFVIAVCLLSFKYGTRNITMYDTMLLVIALAATLVWWQLQNPVLAVLMATGIDLSGYIPTFRKTYREPWSETAGTWAVFALGNGITLFALDSYNLLTITYMAAIGATNIVLAILCIARRGYVAKPF